MQIKFTAARGQFVTATTQAEKIAATATTKAMRETGTIAAAAANRVIHGAGFAGKKWELRPKNFPSSGVSLAPAVWLHSRVNFEDIFHEGGTINAKGGEWLWVPLPSVPKWPGDATRQMSPKKYRQTIGPLFSMVRKDKPPLLGAPVSGNLKAQPFGRFVTRARLKKGKTGKGPTTFIPLFVGVKSVVIEQKFDTEPAIEKATQGIQGLYIKNESKEVI